MPQKDRETNIKQTTESVDEGRRSVIKRLLAGGAVLAAPAITTLVAPGEATADHCGKGKGKGKGKDKGKCGKGKG